MSAGSNQTSSTFRVPALLVTALPLLVGGGVLTLILLMAT